MTEKNLGNLLFGKHAKKDTSAIAGTSVLSKVIRLVNILKELNIYCINDGEKNMLSITESAQNKYVPGLFQIIKLSDGKYLVERLEDGTHESTFNKIVLKVDLLDCILKNIRRDIIPIEMYLCYGPYVIINYTKFD